MKVITSTSVYEEQDGGLILLDCTCEDKSILGIIQCKIPHLIHACRHGGKISQIPHPLSLGKQIRVLPTSNTPKVVVPCCLWNVIVEVIP